MGKKRVLWVSEASFMATGFSVLTYEILKILYASGKYEIAEYGSYAKTTDPRAMQLPWKFYGAIPEDGDEAGWNKYKSSPFGQFGEALFEKVCLDFKPDIVIDVRDWWMCEYELRSPYRDNFKLLWMPTIDGEPQRSEWLDSYMRADGILTYSEYGKSVLEREAPGKINVLGVVKTGVNHNIFKPLDKAKLRKHFGIKPEWKILMTVMRNQRRKLYPDLIEAFAEYLRYCVKQGNDDLAKNSYLYLHTSYPDVGFDIARHILEHGVGHRVLTTYTCEACGFYFSDFFQTELTTCQRCGNAAAHMPNTQMALTRENLVNIINLADAYIQYSICEGFGMPVSEAKACGVPAFGVDYSATSEQVNAPGCQPIKVAKFFYEPVIETEQMRALPDIKDTVTKLYKFFSLPEKERHALGLLAMKDAVDNYTFERSAKIFENAIDQMPINDRRETWDNPRPRLAPANRQIPRFGTNAELIDWCMVNILGKPELIKTYWRNELIKGLNTGFIVGKLGKEQFTPDKAVSMLLNIADSHNYWEHVRLGTANKEDKVRFNVI